MENATDITVQDCILKAGGISGIWMQEANERHRIIGNWVQDFGGFGLYANGVGAGDLRYESPEDANVNKGHVIHNNL